MFESHYLKPFIVSLGITIMLISGMGLSLRGIVGTGVAYDAAEVSFHLPEVSESDAETTAIEPIPKDKPPVEPPTPEGPAPKADPLVTENTGDESVHNLNANKTTSNARREWAVPKAIESETTNNEEAEIGFNKEDLPLFITTKRQGDRLRRGNITKKLSRFFIDEKIPKEIRSQIPVVRSGEKVLGIIGLDTKINKDKRYDYYIKTKG